MKDGRDGNAPSAPLTLIKDEGPFTDAEVAELLGRYGYGPACPRTLLSFQRHFRPDGMTGAADAETVRRLRALVRMTGR